MRQRMMLPVVFAVCAGGGWLVAGSSDGEMDAPQAAAAGMQGKSAEREQRVVRSRAMPAEVGARLIRLRGARTPEERLRAMTELASSIPVSDLSAWYEGGWIECEQTMESLQFYHITKERWLAEDAAGMMDHCLRKDRSRTRDLAAEWGRIDPASAFAFGEALKDSADRSVMMGSIAATAARSHPELALKAIVLYEQPKSGSRWGLDTIIADVAKSAPELLRREAGGLPAELQKYAKHALAQESLKADFAAGVAALATESGGKELFISALKGSKEIVAQMLDHRDSLPEGWLASLLTGRNRSVVERDPERWLNEDLHSMGLTEDQVKDLRSLALKRLANVEPQRLQELLKADEWDPGTRKQAIHAAIMRLAYMDPAKGAEVMAQLTDPEERAVAQATMESLQQDKEQVPKIGSPEELGKLAAYEGRSSMTGVMHAWGEDEIERAAKAFGKLPPAEKDVIAKNLGNWYWGTSHLPMHAAALDHLLRHPSPQAAPGVAPQQRAYALAAMWGSTDPAAASRWVESLPAGEARVWAAKNVAASWAEYYPEQSRKWVEGLDFRAEVEAARVEE